MTDSIESRNVVFAVRSGPRGWTATDGVMHFSNGRLTTVDGVESLKQGPMGVTGTLFVVVDSFVRDTRKMIRIERRKLVSGKVADTHNLGEFDLAPPAPPVLVMPETVASEAVSDVAADCEIETKEAA